MEGIALESISGKALAGADAARTAELKDGLGSKDAEKVAHSFEELLASMLVKEMRKSSGIKLFGESTGSELFEGLFDRYLAETMSQGRGLGIGESYAERVIEDAELRAGQSGENHHEV